MSYADDTWDAEASDWAEEHFKQQENEEAFHSITKCRDSVKSAPIGTVVICPCCKKSFRKKATQQSFCSFKGKGNCKDKFWNMVRSEEQPHD